MKAQILISMLFCGLVGCVVAAIALVVFRQKRATARAVDLISFLLGGIGLVASLIAIGNYERRIQDANRLSELTHDAVVAVERIFSAVRAACPLTEQRTDPKAGECRQLSEYIRSFSSLTYTRGELLPIPGFPIFTNVETNKAVDEIVSVVGPYRIRAGKFLREEQERQLGRSFVDELVTIINAAYILSFAFGMGIVRRFFDLYVDARANVTSPGQIGGLAKADSAVAPERPDTGPKESISQS
jgi:hypothetical protein